LKPGQSEVGDLVGRLELRPVTYAVQPLIPPLGVHVPAAVDHLVLGEVLVLARPYPEGRDSAALPPSYDRREVIGPVPVEPSGKPTGPRQVRDGLLQVGITITCEGAKPTKVVSSEPTLSDAWNLPEQHVVGLALLFKTSEHKRAWVPYGYRDMPPNQLGTLDCHQPTEIGAPVMPDHVKRLIDLDGGQEPRDLLKNSVAAIVGASRWRG